MQYNLFVDHSICFRREQAMSIERILLKKLLESFPTPEPWVWGRAWESCNINLFNTMTNHAPKSGGNSTAIIQWILLCLFFIAIPILEYALILSYKKYKKPSSVHGKNIEGQSKEWKTEEMFNRWDKGMTVILPSTFMVFTLVFWLIHYFQWDAANNAKIKSVKILSI